MVAEIDYQINTDAIFLKGTDHLVCQDYATNFGSNKENSHIIVCDGCSSSPMSDVGARLIALETAQIISIEKNTEEILKFLKWNFEHSFQFEMRINPFILDATLLFAYINKEFLNLAMYGDGCCIVKYKNDQLEMYNRVFKNSYPNYFSYQLDEQRYENYLALKETTFIENYIGSTKENLHRYAIWTPFMSDNYMQKSFSLNTIEWIILASDGIHSFYKKDENGKRTSIDFLEIVKQLVDFKNFHGVFVERHVRSLIKRLEKQNIFHYDDFSVAGLYVKN